VKWRLHWLELRLRELAYQRARHEEAYAQLCGAATDAEATAEGGSHLEATLAQQTPSVAGAAYGWACLSLFGLIHQSAISIALLEGRQFTPRLARACFASSSWVWRCSVTASSHLSGCTQLIEALPGLHAYCYPDQLSCRLSLMVYTEAVTSLDFCSWSGDSASERSSQLSGGDSAGNTLAAAARCNDVACVCAARQQPADR